ncbi:MAG TPA: tetratricopeptide repeat protein [Candidatus Hydrogenedentes bacterium]|nr:tetratricopeptide repeat protein [Candidatus Hydrogenedentota bacterium]HRK32960.1 tetratricopeptide repeat protein [Candidatus Hydrogenedentota bacterium]
MDLSRLKWPLIIIVIVGVGWLVTDGGVKWLRAKFNEGTPGQDIKQDEFNEQGLTNLAGFLIKTFRYASAEQVILDAMERYPQGKNFLNNKYRLAKCVEKQGRYEECIQILADLRDMDANQYDPRVPEVDVLNLRIDKLAETHELGEVGQR